MRYIVQTVSLGTVALLLSIGCSTSVSDEAVEADRPLYELDGQDLLIAVGELGAQPEEGASARRVRVRFLPVTDGESLYLETDASLRVEDGITIQDLQAIAHEAPTDPQHRDLLLKIFNEYGVSMSYLPRGFAAGLGASIDLSDDVDASNVLEHLTGALWYGKYFERPNQCSRLARGANRIGGNARIDFVARLIPGDQIDRFVENAASLGVDARSDYVDLNYKLTLPGMRRMSLEDPNTHSDDAFPVLRLLAGLVERLGVYDLGVMIPGKNGPILVGRTWLGEYADNREQTYSATSLEGRQIAWFFLDFNEAAIRAQETPRRSRVEYTSKSACDRRSTSAEPTELPDPRPL